MKAWWASLAAVLVAVGAGAADEAKPETPAKEPAAAIKDIGEADFAKEVEEFKGVVIVDFWAAWCPPCRKLGADMKELAPKFPTVKFVKIDVDKNKAIAAKFKISGIPYVAVFKDGKKVDEMTGYPGKAKLEAFFKAASEK